MISSKQITLAVVGSLICRDSRLELGRQFNRLLSRGGVMVTDQGDGRDDAKRMDSKID